MDPAGWAWVVVLTGVGLIDYGLTRLHQSTMSQWLRALSKRLGWVKWAVVGALVFFAWHLFWQQFNEPPPQPPPAPIVESCWDDC